MTFVRTDSTVTVRDALAKRIGDRLAAGTPVLFLASGGSTAAIAADVCGALRSRFVLDPGIPARFLTVSLVDERFGLEGHPDSNWRLLLEKGLRPEDMRTMPILAGASGRAEGLEDATDRFDAFLADAAARADRGELFIAGLFGIGSDGHTAGILPESPASEISAGPPCAGCRLPFASGYRSTPFSRITVSPAFFPHIGFAAVYAAGSGKWPVLENLQKELPVRDQPAQLLKLAKETLIFSDRIPGPQGASE